MYKECKILYINNYLYFSSDDDIREGEWCYHIPSKEIVKYPKGGFPKGHSKKIIASTQKSLNLPQCTQQFVEYFVMSHNKGHIIDAVEVEYEEVGENCGCYYTKFCKAPAHIETGESCRDEKHYQPKVDADYCVRIKDHNDFYIKFESGKPSYIRFFKDKPKQPKESWSREEVIRLIEHFHICADGTKAYEKKFIEENL